MKEGPAGRQTPYLSDFGLFKGFLSVDSELWLF
jgi:hypothetical protein